MSAKRRKARRPKRSATKGGKRAASSAARRKKRKKRPLPRSVKRPQQKATATTKAARHTARAAASSTTKADLRRALRAQRARLTSQAQRHAAERMAAHLVGTRLFLASRRIGCYLPNDGEIDPRGILERIWRMGKTAYLPVLARLPQGRLWFAPARPDMELTSNRFGIPEPRVAARELVRAEELDLVLLPVVAFDNKGNRLGRGAGFYDRSLAFLQRRRFLRKPHLLGLAHDFQRVPALPADPWDVPLDGVVTDQAVYYTSA